MSANLRKDFKLFWVSILLLFLELLIIRWVSAEIRIFAYFHNLVLLICFLGIGLGCARSRGQTNFVAPLIILGLLVFFIYCPFDLGIFSARNMTAYLGNLKDFVIWYQTVSQGARKTREIALGILMLGSLSASIVYLFAPFGQLLGRLLAETDRPIRAYTVNIIGSLAGILLFTGLSFISAPPTVWFILLFIFIIALLFTEKQGKLPISLALAAMGLMLALLFRHEFVESRENEKQVIWSPYQKLEVVPMDERFDSMKIRVGYVINVNNVPYQQAINLSYDFIKKNPHIYGFRDPELSKFDHYNLPYLFGNELEDVLIVGAGAGNDVAGALRNGAKHVDAVEIDPRIIRIGKSLHPERPYDSGRVTLINDDARSFFHRAKKKYDLVVFGLLDSHTLSSNLSNVRLDNYVYTLESIKEAGNLLKPGGTVVLIFDVRDAFIGKSLFEIMMRVFGADPVCFKLGDSIRGWGGNVFVGGNPGTISSTMTRYPFLHALVDKTFASASAPAVFPTDDWPYLYLNSRSIPSLYYIIFGFLMLISVAMVRRNFSSLSGFDWHFFFLGAGFLLIEVQNVSKLALLFGATWTVNSIVISAILVMILFANYYTAKVKIESHAPYYAGLAISLILLYFLPLERLAGFPFAGKAAVSGILLSLPIFFAGIIFAHSFSKSKELNRVFGSNLLGAMLGGMLECASFVAGIKALLLLALVLYVLSYITIKKSSDS